LTGVVLESIAAAGLGAVSSSSSGSEISSANGIGDDEESISIFEFLVFIK
jgi:hypothetical protein